MRQRVGGRAVPRLSDRVRLVILGLATLGLLTLGMGVARLSAPALARPADTATGSAAQHGAHAGLVADDPVLIALDSALREQGIVASLRQLAALGANDPGVRQREHHYSVEVGRLSYARTHDAAESFQQCGAALDTGCYHGVMDAFMVTTRQVAPEAVARLCDGDPITAAAPVLRIQCVHGVGHGLASVFGNRVASALAACDGFGADQDRNACYSGVFQQSIEQTDERSDADPFAPDLTLPDPFAACDALAERYQRVCYIQQPTVILASNGEDVPAAFATCDQAPAAFVVPCYQGVGAWISIFTHWDPDQTSDLCWLADTPFRPWCLDGAVAGMASTEATADRPMALCHSTPPDLRGFCFETLGERIPAFYADRTAQERACALAQDPAWIQVCRRGAGLTSSASETG